MESRKFPRKLKSANQAEILRSHQRDDNFINNLREKWLDLLKSYGRKNNFLYLTHSDVPFRLIYFIFTSGLSNQTLGEEYTGIVQADLEAYKVPPLTSRILAAILECFADKMIISALKEVQQSVNKPENGIKPGLVTFADSLLTRIPALIPTVILIHKGLFYIYGRYYSLGKRVAGIDYAKVYGHRPTDSVGWGLRLLGVATLVQALLKVYQNIQTQDSNNKSLMVDEERILKTCQMCLSETPTTATPCGHIFCWKCLTDWLNAKSQCPFCREHVVPSRIIYAMNL